MLFAATATLIFFICRGPSQETTYRVLEEQGLFPLKPYNRNDYGMPVEFQREMRRNTRLRHWDAAAASVAAIDRERMKTHRDLRLLARAGVFDEDSETYPDEIRLSSHMRESFPTQWPGREVHPLFPVCHGPL